jgi:hypothetical protein
METVQYDPDVVGEGVDLVPAGRLAGGAESPAGNRQDVEVIDPPGREIIKLVAGIVEAGKKEERRTGTAPVQHFEADAWPSFTKLTR